MKDNNREPDRIARGELHFCVGLLAKCLWLHCPLQVEKLITAVRVREGQRCSAVCSSLKKEEKSYFVSHPVLRTTFRSLQRIWEFLGNFINMSFSFCMRKSLMLTNKDGQKHKLCSVSGQYDSFKIITKKFQINIFDCHNAWLIF